MKIGNCTDEQIVDGIITPGLNLLVALKEGGSGFALDLALCVTEGLADSILHLSSNKLLRLNFEGIHGIFIKK